MAPSLGLLVSPLTPPAPGILLTSTSGCVLTAALLFLPSPAFGFLTDTHFQATKSKQHSEVALQHQIQVSHCLLDQGLTISISHTPPPYHGWVQAHLHPHFPTQLWSSCFSAPPSNAHVVLHPAGTLPTVLFYFFLPRHPLAKPQVLSQLRLFEVHL